GISAYLVISVIAGDSFSGKLIIHKRAPSHRRITVIAYIHSAKNDINRAGFVRQLERGKAD
ncbi:MAG: hypothetical protein E6123_13190, partial [Clostridiales bacterium]|nr:hypothetical protein [Clostridiales bacterium]